MVRASCWVSVTAIIRNLCPESTSSTTEAIHVNSIVKMKTKDVELWNKYHQPVLYVHPPPICGTTTDVLAHGKDGLFL